MKMPTMGERSMRMEYVFFSHPPNANDAGRQELQRPYVFLAPRNKNDCNIPEFCQSLHLQFLYIATVFCKVFALMIASAPMNRTPASIC